MYDFNNLGLCHSKDGIAPGFAVHLCDNERPVSAQGTASASVLNMSEMFMLAMIAQQLLDSPKA